jgi:hypothetical protein
VTTPATPRFINRLTRIDPGGRGAGVLAAVDDEHRAWRAFFDRLALGVVAGSGTR